MKCFEDIEKIDKSLDKEIFSLDLKMLTNMVVSTLSGKEFQIFDPATVNERSLSLMLVLGMIRLSPVEERRS